MKNKKIDSVLGKKVKFQPLTTLDDKMSNVVTSRTLAKKIKESKL